MLITSNHGFLGTWAAGFLELRAIQIMFWEFKFFFENQFEKFWKIINLGTLCQRASQINNFLKIIKLGTPWSPESYIPSLRTRVNHG